MSFDDCSEIPILCKLVIQVEYLLLIITTFIPRYSPFTCRPLPTTAKFDDMATSELSQTFVLFYLILCKNEFGTSVGVDTFHHNLLVDAQYASLNK
jgi:hypothetical protein